MSRFEIAGYYTTLMPEMTEALDLLVSHIAGRGFIAGSFPAWLAAKAAYPQLCRGNPHDIDVFGFDENSHDEVVTRLCEAGCLVVSENDSVTELELPAGVLSCTSAIQVMRPIHNTQRLTYGTESEVVSRFDFSVCSAWLDNSTGAVHVLDTLLGDWERGGLRVRPMLGDPFGTLVRVCKYARRGFDLDIENSLTVFEAFGYLLEQDPQILRSVRAFLNDYRSWLRA